MPSLVLQPLVENAFRHGLAQRAAGGRVVVRASVRGAQLVVCVEDDGVGLSAGWTFAVHAGIGLAVTCERVQARGPLGAGVLAVRRGPHGGTSAEISLPFRAAVPTQPEPGDAFA